MYAAGYGFPEPVSDEPPLMSGQDEFARVDEAFSAKLSSRACPVCGRGEFEPLPAPLVARSQPAAAAEPIETVAQVCVRCGFLATHAVKYLLEKESQ
jgi:ribosomal protein S27AE